MKKILSLLVLCALLLATLGISASAAAYYDISNTNTRVTVKKSDSVVIDGVISEGEYEEYTDGYSEWYVAENASEYFDDAEAMAASTKWYFSWDGEYLNIAAQWDAGRDAEQPYAGGDYYGDYAYEDVLIADAFLGYGPGMNVVSAEVSPEDEAWTRTFVTVGENSTTGEKIIGMYSGQNGQNQDYKPEVTDFDFTYNDSIVTAEYRLPIIELLETFKANQAGQMFKASITLQAGVAAQFEEEGVEIQPATYGWGVRLGQFGYCSDSGNLDKTWATFRLVDEEIEQPDITPEPPVTTPEPPVTTPEPPVTTPDPETPDNTPVDPETPDNTPVDPETPDNTPVDPETPDNTPDAPPTGDIMVVAAVVSAISACGVMIAKKRR